jgi:outer membrane protein OmpA-like peptidoglycan-associated protein
MTSPAKLPSSPAHRFRRSAFFIFHFSFFILPSCSMLRGPLDPDSDDSADMQPHPRRTETPSLIGPDSVRVRSGKFPVVQFAGDDWKLPSGEAAKVRSVAQWLTGNPERVLIAAGARAESPEYARQLSDLRAQTVRRALIAAGVPEERILTVSFGEDAPPSTGNGVSF